jgi:hypothetical protein
MKKTLTAIALAATLAQPAAAITFPSLTTIYVGAGVYDTGGTGVTGTLFKCANVSGQSATIRLLVLDETGAVAGTPQTTTIPHGGSVQAATNDGTTVSGELNLAIGEQEQGAVVNIESTQSGVFCNAIIFDTDARVGDGAPLPLVRVNPHPGTVE